MTRGDAIRSLAPLIEISLDYEAEAHATNPDHLSLSAVKKQAQNRYRETPYRKIPIQRNYNGQIEEG